MHVGFAVGICVVGFITRGARLILVQQGARTVSFYWHVGWVGAFVSARFVLLSPTGAFDDDMYFTKTNHDRLIAFCPFAFSPFDILLPHMFSPC